MKVVGYVRVSTDKQAEVGFGLEVQEAAIRQWAKTNGHRLVGIYRDEGVSGSNGVGERLGLAEAVGLLKAGGAAGLVLYRLDRLARDLMLQERVLAVVWRAGAEVFSCSASEAGQLKPDDPEDPTRKLLRRLLGGVAEWERDMIRLRLRSGQKRKAALGGYAGGRPAFGFRAEDRALVADEAEQAALRRIMALRAEGLSLRGISARLAEEGVAPKSGGERWHIESLRQVIAREEGRPLRPRRRVVA